MFRSTKRRKRPTGRAFRTDEDDDDDERVATTIVQPAKKPAQRRQQRPVVVVGAGTQRRRGHAAVSIYNNNNVPPPPPDADEQEQPNDGGGGYSKEALAQLMAEQQKAAYYSRTTRKNTAAATTADTFTTTTTTQQEEEDPTVRDTRVQFAAATSSLSSSTAAAATAPDNEEEEEDFIALQHHGNSKRQQEPTSFGNNNNNNSENDQEVLAGDEAFGASMARPGLSLLKDNADFTTTTTMMMMDDTTTNDDDDERMLHLHDEVVTTDDWEARLAQRAGITTTTTTAPRSHNNNNTSSSLPLPTNKNNTTLDSIRDAVTRSLRQNQSQQSDIADRIRRRQQELSHATALDHHETQVQAAGTQWEYVQHVRNRFLCAWVGAMQEVQPKIQAVLLDPNGSLCTIQGEWAKVQEQVEWERDVILAVLQEKGLVEQVLMGGGGGDGQQQQHMPAVAAIQQVDEFGRDVQSQHVLRRDKRRARRRRIRAERPVTTGNVEEDPDLSDEEQAQLQERHAALRAAASVAWNELDTEYTRLDGLIDVFSEWYAKYPKEYEQCYASLSLADLASVLVQTELCQAYLWSAAGAAQSDEENETGFCWVATIEKAVSSHVMDAAGVDRLVEKAILPVVDGLCQQKGIHLISKRQVGALGRLLKAVESIGDTSSPAKGLVSLRRKVEMYIQERLDEVSVAILVPSATTRQSSPGNDETDEAVNQATIGQLCRMEMIVSNVVNCLVLTEDVSLNLAKPMLDFVSQKFLFALSSLLRDQSREHGRVSPPSAPVAVLHRLHDALLPTGWLDQPELLLQSAPLRAAMAAY